MAKVQAIIAGPWQVNTEPEGGWRGPASAVGSLDLSSIPQQSEPTNQQDRGNGLFVVEVESLDDIPDGFTVFGTGRADEIQLDGWQRSAFDSMFGGHLPDDVGSVESAYRRKLTTLSDVSGDTGPKPLQPAKTGGRYGLEINFGGNRSNERFGKSHEFVPVWADSIQRGIRDAVKSYGQEQAEKYAGFLFDEIGRETGTKPDDSSELIPSELRGTFRHRKPETTVDEPWDDLDDWDLEEGEWEVIANQLKASNLFTTTGHLTHSTALSSPDHSIAASLCRNRQSGRHGQLIRYTDLDNHYKTYSGNSSYDGVMVVRKRVGGVNTNIGTVTTSINSGDWYQRFAVSGSSITLQESTATILTTASVDHSSVSLTLLGTITDTAITGGLVSGFYVYGDFIASDDTLFGPAYATDGVSAGGGGGGSSQLKKRLLQIRSNKEL